MAHKHVVDEKSIQLSADILAKAICAQLEDEDLENMSFIAGYLDTTVLMDVYLDKIRLPLARAIIEEPAKREPARRAPKAEETLRDEMRLIDLSNQI